MAVVTSGVLDAAIEEIWAMVSDFGGLKRWHPQLARVDSNGGSVVGATRKAYFIDGRSATERLERLDNANHVLAYAVVDDSGKPTGMTGTIELTKLGERQTKVQWTSSGVPPETTGAAERNEWLRNYYTMRINSHLKSALDLGDQ